MGSIEDFKMYRSNFTSGFMMFGAKDERSEVPNHVSVKKFSGLEQVSTELLKMIREEEFTTPSLKSHFEVEKKKSEVQEINDHIIINPIDNTVTGVYQYFEDKLKLLGRMNKGPGAALSKSSGPSPRSRMSLGPSTSMWQPRRQRRSGSPSPRRRSRRQSRSTT